MSTEGWLIAVDRGGTFTDFVAHGPEGETVSGKVLARPGREFENISSWIGCDALPEGTRLRVGTTVATNALLTGDGAATALLITRGLGDLPLIGHQARPDIFALDIQRVPPLARWVVEVDERVRADGVVVRELHRESVRDRLSSLKSAGCAVVVVALAHAVAFPDHELMVGELAAEFDFVEVVLSHRVSPRAGLVDRMEEGDLISLISFNGRARSVVRDLEVSANGDAIRDAIGDLQANGNTCNSGRSPHI